VTENGFRILGWEMTFFAHQSESGSEPIARRLSSELRAQAPVAPVFDDTRAIRTLHRRLRKALNRIETVGGCQEQLDGFSGVNRRTDGAFNFTSILSPESQFLSAVWATLVDLGPRFRHCKRHECGRYFLAVDRRRVFHDDRCATVARSRRYRRAKPTDAAQRKSRERRKQDEMRRKQDETLGDAYPPPRRRRGKPMGR
jgi:hypothetical protein